MCHYRGAFLPEYSWLPAEQQTPGIFLFYAFTRLGHEAVLVFFVLSGFLVGGRAIEKCRMGTFCIKSYAVDRFVRIMLPLLSALLLCIPKDLICGNPIVWTDWFGCLFSLQGIWTGLVIEPLWSLAYEVWFYILAGGLVLAICSTRQRSRYWGWLLAAVCFLVFTKLQAYYLLIWMLGALTYVVAPKRFNKWVFGLTLILLPVLIMVLQLTSGGHVTSSLVQLLPTQNRQSLEIIFSLNFCLFLQQVLLIQPRNKASLALNHWGTKLAAFSYTLYLVHVLVMRLLQNYGAERAAYLTLQSVALYFAYTFIGMLVCYGVYWCFERHTYAVKRWIKKRI